MSPFGTGATVGGVVVGSPSLSLFGKEGVSTTIIVFVKRTIIVTTAGIVGHALQLRSNPWQTSNDDQQQQQQQQGAEQHQETLFL